MLHANEPYACRVVVPHRCGSPDEASGCIKTTSQILSQLLKSRIHGEQNESATCCDSDLKLMNGTSEVASVSFGRKVGKLMRVKAMNIYVLTFSSPPSLTPSSM